MTSIAQTTAPTTMHAGTDPAAEMIELLYAEIEKIARRERFRAGSPQTMQTTALINQAYLRIGKTRDWQGRSHFLGCAATAMRHVLIDAARARSAAKRAGQHHAFDDLAESALPIAEDRELIALGDALRTLQDRDPLLAKLVDCRFFAGLDERETARILGVTDRTVRRWWVQARAILYAEMDATAPAEDA